MSRGGDGGNHLGETITATGVASPPGPADLPRGAAFGRYLVLDLLGRGGMGVVYSGYDPDLDRKVAVKILRPEALSDQSRLIREARAMARLQHPHVAVVYDVGTVDGRAFVAMELVEGTTLSRWLDEQPRSWREVIGMFRQTGEGLAAAHAAGIVHRDFKPANVLVGRDGRVRVADFGLSRSVSDAEPADERSNKSASRSALPESVTRTGAILGTPSYMPPEQFAGQTADAKSDQFSFCVALYRALYGERPFAGEDLATIAAEVTAGRLRPPPKDSPVPGWLRGVVVRGLATDPSARWPSMDALLDALAPETRGSRRWLVVGGVATVLVTFGLVWGGIARKESLRCRGAERNLVGVWDDARKQAVHAAFVATGKPYAEDAFRSVTRALDAFAGAWTSTHTDACEATRVRREQSEELMDLRMECLGRQLQDARAQVDVLASADAAVVERAAHMVSSLSSVAECNDVASLRAPVRPPADAATKGRLAALAPRIAEVKALYSAARYKKAIPIAEAAVTDARAIAYRPTEAVTLFWLGEIQRAMGDPKTGAKTLEDATVAARAGRDALTESKAWASLAWAADLQAQYDQAQAAARHGFAALEALGGNHQSQLGDLFERTSGIYTSQGKYQEALDNSLRALAIHEKASGRDSLDVANTLDLVAQALGCLGRHEEAEHEIRRALAIAERERGPNHPDVAFKLFELGYALNGERRYDEALAAYRRALAIRERVLGPENRLLVVLLTNMADIYLSLRKYDEAVAYNRRALAIGEKTVGPEHPNVGLVRSNLADALQEQGKLDEAMSDYRRAIAIWGKVFDADHPYFAPALTGIGRIELQRHRPAEALPVLERAVRLYEKGPLFSSELAQARFALACAQWESGRDRVAARALAGRARAAYAAAGPSRANELADVDAWLGSHH
jgi:tetratricopeptide (TPR) repeat protein/predicted Ser/Thr protein kinase